MKLLYITSLCCCIVSASFGQYNDPNFPKPASGYGADGAHTIGVISFENPYFETENIKIYYPSDITTKVPTLFYSHAYGGNIPLHVIGLMSFVAQKGYAIVFVPYQTTGVSIENRYENLLEGFRKAARDYSSIIDTTKVGFMGHSFGGGATFATAYTCFTQNNWGQNGRFMHASAPWYAYNISQAELQSFPSDTKLLVEVYDDDNVNDHRMAADLFTNINIAADEKDFIIVKADTINGYIYSAGHDVPTNYSAFDALDYYAYYRLIDALCDYTFNGNIAGKEVALGNGNAAQVTMPSGMKNLIQTDAPVVAYPESKYTFECSAIANPRKIYCGAVTSVATAVPDENSLVAYPNPFTTQVQISNLPETAMCTLFNKLGQTIYTGNSISTQDFSYLPTDIYLLVTGNKSETKTFILFKE